MTQLAIAFTTEDQGRAAAQRGRVWTVVVDGGWHTLAGIAARTGDPEASISARLRDLRRPEHGAHTVERRRVREGGGLFEYRVIVKP
jgi:hypothetical protein